MTCSNDSINTCGQLASTWYGRCTNGASIDLAARRMNAKTLPPQNNYLPGAKVLSSSDGTRPVRTSRLSYARLTDNHRYGSRTVFAKCSGLYYTLEYIGKYAGVLAYNARRSYASPYSQGQSTIVKPAIHGDQFNQTGRFTIKAGMPLQRIAETTRRNAHATNVNVLS